MKVVIGLFAFILVAACASKEKETQSSRGPAATKLTYQCDQKMEGLARTDKTLLVIENKVLTLNSTKPPMTFTDANETETKTEIVYNTVTSPADTAKKIYQVRLPAAAFNRNSFEGELRLGVQDKTLKFVPPFWKLTCKKAL